MSKITLAPEDAKALFDIAVGSMDFGSGFLDNEEVDILRAFAVKLGLDPMEATPSNFRKTYPHAFRAEEPGPYWVLESVARHAANPRCYWCLVPRSIHEGEAES